MVMTHLMTGKVMTGQEFIDLADPQEKMRRLNPHSRIGFMFPVFALVRGPACSSCLGCLFRGFIIAFCFWLTWKSEANNHMFFRPDWNCFVWIGLLLPSTPIALGNHSCFEKQCVRLWNLDLVRFLLFLYFIEIHNWMITNCIWTKWMIQKQIKLKQIH